MTIRIYRLAVCASILAAICCSPPRASAQSSLSGATVPIEMVTVDGEGKERRRTSLDGVMEPVGLPTGEQTAITLVASANKAGQPVMISPLDGGEVIAPATLSVANDGTVGFSFTPGQTRGLYRVLVTLGVHQYELQLYAFRPGVNQ